MREERRAPRCPYCGSPMRRYGRGSTYAKRGRRWQCAAALADWTEWRETGWLPVSPRCPEPVRVWREDELPTEDLTDP